MQAPRPNIIRPPYTPTSPVIDPMMSGGGGGFNLYGVSTGSGGLRTEALRQKKSLIGGAT